MNEIWFILCALLLLPYLLIPVLIKLHQSFSLKPQLRKILGDFLPIAVQTYFDETTHVLKELGFEHKIDVVSLDYGPNLRVLMRLFVERTNFIIATCSSLVPDGKDQPVRNFLELSTKFLDGLEVSTHNSELSSAPIEHKQKITSALPLVSDIRVLYQFHRQTLSNLADKTQAIIPDDGREFEFLAQTFKDDLSRQVELGCLELDTVNSCYRPTWAGAFLMGWYSMWPISPIRRFMQKIRGNIKIRALQKASS